MKTKGLVVGEANLSLRRTQSIEGPNPNGEIVEAALDMLHLWNSAASYDISTVFARVFETILIGRLRRGAVDNVVLERLKRRSKSDSFVKAIVKWNLYTRMFTRPVAGFIVQRVDPDIRKYSLRKLYKEMGRAEMKGAIPSPSILSSKATEKSCQLSKRESYIHRGSKKKHRS